jgi:hypothetical protein
MAFLQASTCKTSTLASETLSRKNVANIFGMLKVISNLFVRNTSTRTALLVDIFPTSPNPGPLLLLS